MAMNKYYFPDIPLIGIDFVGARFIGRIFSVNRPMNRAPTMIEPSNGYSGFINRLVKSGMKIGLPSPTKETQP